MSPRRKPNGPPNPNSITETSRLLAGDPAIMAQYFKKYQVRSMDELYHKLFSKKNSHEQMTKKEWGLLQAMGKVAMKNHQAQAAEHGMHYEHGPLEEGKPTPKALRENPIIKAMRRNKRRPL